MSSEIKIKSPEKNNSIEASKIEVIKELIFGENISSYEQEFSDIKERIQKQKLELLDIIDSTRKELDTAIDSLSTDLNIRITDIEEKFIAKADELDSKKIDKKVLGDLLITLGTKISD